MIQNLLFKIVLLLLMSSMAETYIEIFREYFRALRNYNLFQIKSEKKRITLVLDILFCKKSSKSDDHKVSILEITKSNYLRFETFVKENTHSKNSLNSMIKVISEEAEKDKIVIDHQNMLCLLKPRYKHIKRALIWSLLFIAHFMLSEIASNPYDTFMQRKSLLLSLDWNTEARNFVERNVFDSAFERIYYLEYGVKSSNYFNDYAFINWLPYTKHSGKFVFQKVQMKSNFFENSKDTLYSVSGSRYSEQDIDFGTGNDYFIDDNFQGFITNYTWPIHNKYVDNSLVPYGSYEEFLPCADPDMNSGMNNTVYYTFCDLQSKHDYYSSYTNQSYTGNREDLNMLLFNDRIFDINLANASWMLILVNLEQKSIALVTSDHVQEVGGAMTHRYQVDVTSLINVRDISLHNYNIVSYTFICLIMAFVTIHHCNKKLLK